MGLSTLHHCARTVSRTRGGCIPWTSRSICVIESFNPFLFMSRYILPMLPVCAFVMFAAHTDSNANGGGYSRGGVRSAGDVEGFEPKATEQVRMLDELLHIKLGKVAANVEIRYLMRNESDRKVKVRFGFPVEEVASKDLTGGSVPAPAKNHSYCRVYQITAGGKPVRFRWQAEKNPEKDVRITGISGWMVSEITFPAGGEIPVMIRFASDYPLDHWYVSENGSTSAALFRYRLSSAACWNGTIGTGRIILEPDGIQPADLRVLRPVNRFKKDGNRWVWNFTDLEPTLADDLEIECQPAMHVYGEQPIGEERVDHPAHLRADYVERGKQWSMVHSNYTIKASSTLAPSDGARYDAENIRMRWEENAWSEGAEGPGIGEWLEITPVEAKPLIELQLKAGYQKGGLFRLNARPKTIRVELNGEHRFDATIPDKIEETSIPVIGYDKPVRKIRMTFTEVYPGTRYEDLCVTELLLHVRLDRKPNLRPSR